MGLVRRVDISRQFRLDLGSMMGLRRQALTSFASDNMGGSETIGSVLKRRQSRQDVSRQARRFLVILCLVLCLCPCKILGASRVEAVSAKISRGKRIYVEHRVRRGDSYILISKRWTGTSLNWRSIRRFNGNRRLLAGTTCDIPYSLLLPKYRHSAIMSLFPSDGYRDGAWHHKVKYRGETLCSISEWFTGSPNNASQVKRHSKLTGILKIGATVRIPSSLLQDAFKTREASPAGTDQLVFKKDSKGEYASYKLRKGEALYSSVVVRYTGRISHDDVMDVVEKICSRSGIWDVKKIPVGFEVKIPVDLMLASYLPRDSPRRKEYEANLKKVSQFRNVSRARDLEGVHVILDPGHGGRDPGAIGRTGIYEDEYAYDVVCRIRRILLTETKAEVHLTSKDRVTGYEVRDSSRLPSDKNEVLLTNPPYANSNSRISANLRCFLVASIYRRLPSAAKRANRVVFTSVHADSLYASLYGATIYVPDAYLSRKHLTRSGGIYDRTKEVCDVGSIKMSYAQRISSEGYSMDLADELLASLKRHGVETLSYHPVRDRVTRGRREYVPAVIRHNPVPTKLLLEVANLKNYRDCRSLMNPEYRERVAKAYVDALRHYYDRTESRLVRNTE